MVEPVDPLERRVLDVIDPLPRPASADELGLVEPDDGLGEGVVVAVALGSDRVHGTLLTETLGVADREVLTAPITVVDQLIQIASSPDRHLQCVQREVGSQRPRRPPTDDRRLYASMMNEV